LHNFEVIRQRINQCVLEVYAMTEPSSPKYQFPGDIDRTQLRTEQQLDPMINRKMIMPNPLDPMGNIAAEGRAMRSISSGRMPKWILMTAWGLRDIPHVGNGLEYAGRIDQSGPRR
jgi:hypothetical protein